MNAAIRGGAKGGRRPILVTALAAGLGSTSLLVAVPMFHDSHIGTAAVRPGQSPPPPDRPVSYSILPEASLLQVHTYKAGLLGSLGHEHDVRARAFAGTVIYDAQDPSASRVELTVRTDSLFVVVASDSSDIPDITRAMREEVLHVEGYPEITFRSTAVEVRDSALDLRGDLTMVGRTRPVAMVLALDVTPEILHVRGSFTVKQTDFGIRPYGTALGTIKVRDEVTFLLDVRALATR